jgi:hypothetical protein
MGQVVWVILVTAVLLLGAFLILLRARKAGWLGRWQVQGIPGGEGASKRTWQVQTQRVGRGIVVHTLERPGQVLVLVESRTGVTAASLAPVDPSPEWDEP